MKPAVRLSIYWLIFHPWAEEKDMQPNDYLSFTRRKAIYKPYKENSKPPTKSAQIAPIAELCHHVFWPGLLKMVTEKKTAGAAPIKTLMATNANKSRRILASA